MTIVELDEIASTARLAHHGWEQHNVLDWYFVAHALPADGDLLHDTDDDLVEIGRGLALIVPVFGPRSPFDVLDEHSQAAMNVGEILFDASTGALAEDFTEQIESLGNRVLLLAEIEIDPRHRGQGLGRLIAGLVIETLSPGALAVVCNPAPLHPPLDENGEPRDYTDREWTTAVAKLTKLWSTLGFREFRGGLLFIE